jgi:hypothetical protein
VRVESRRSYSPAWPGDQSSNPRKKILNTNVQLRISVINRPDDLPALKLHGWLMQQVRGVQEMHDMLSLAQHFHMHKSDA